MFVWLVVLFIAPTAAAQEKPDVKVVTLQLTPHPVKTAQGVKPAMAGIIPIEAGFVTVGVYGRQFLLLAEGMADTLHIPRHAFNAGEKHIFTGSVSIAVLETDSSGRSLRLALTALPAPGRPLQRGAVLKNMGLQQVGGGKEINLHSLKGNGKYKYLYCWGAWNKNSLQQLSALKNIQQKFARKLEVITLNYLDADGAAVAGVAAAYGIRGKNVFATRDALMYLGVTRFPAGILVDQNFRIIRKDLPVSGLDEQLLK